MILSIWKPHTKLINKKQTVIYYSLFNGCIGDKGNKGYKVIWKCDNINCNTPNKIHSINRIHLDKSRSIKLNEDLQICKSCQQKGELNSRYGDKRKWEDIMGKEKASLIKSIYRDKFVNKNPSKLDDVKKKKGQIIINFENVCKYVKCFGFKLNNISGDNKNAYININCPNGHTYETKYIQFKRGYRCRECYYESLRINIEDIKRFEQYNKKVRMLTSINYRKNKIIIDPFNLKSKLYHVDHIYSIADGFRNNIDPKIISSVHNLRIVDSEYNLKKGSKSDISIEDLLEKYNQTIF